MKVWQSQVNVSAWLQGQYVLAAIGSCLPDGCHYPEKPLEIFKSSNKSLSAEEERKQKLIENENAIRERSKKIDELLSNKSNINPIIIGEKRI